MEHRHTFRPRLLAPLLLGIALATTGCGGDDKDDDNKVIMPGDLIGTLHGELAPYLKEGLGLEPAIADFNTPVESLDDVVILSDPNGIARPHPGLALLKQAYDSGRAVVLEHVKAEEVQALLDTLDKRISFTPPDGLEYVELFATRKAGGDSWHYTDGGAPQGTDDSALQQRRVDSLIAWVKETKDVPPKPKVSSSEYSDIQRIAEAQIHKYSFPDNGQTFEITYSIYSSHSFNNDLDFYFVAQSSNLNPKILWHNDDGYYYDGVLYEPAHQYGWMRHYDFSNYWQQDPNGAAPLDRHAPQSSSGHTQITSGMGWEMGGSFGLSGSLGTDSHIAVNPSLSFGLSYNHSETVEVADVTIIDQSGANGRAQTAAWTYSFADPDPNGENHNLYQDMKDAPYLSRSNFQPFNQWIWVVPSDFSYQDVAKTFQSEFSWVNGQAQGRRKGLWFIEFEDAQYSDWMSDHHSISVPVKRPPHLAISSSQMDFKSAGESQSIALVSSLDWKAESDASWLSVMEKSGDKTDANGIAIHITADPNDSGADRTATVKLYSTDGREEQVLKVFQSRY